MEWTEGVGMVVLDRSVDASKRGVGRLLERGHLKSRFTRGCDAVWRPVSLVAAEVVDWPRAYREVRGREVVHKTRILDTARHVAAC